MTERFNKDQLVMVLGKYGPYKFGFYSGNYDYAYIPDLPDMFNAMPGSKGWILTSNLSAVEELDY